MSISKRKEIILKILKAIESGEKDITSETYDIDKNLFFEISQMIENEGFVKNIIFTFGANTNYTCSSITLKGLDYIESNDIGVVEGKSI